MKKILLFLSFLLMSIGMWGGTIVTFEKSDFAGQGTANTGSEVTATKGGVTFTFSKGYCADESLRCYAHGALYITSETTIEKINFTTTGGKTGGLDPEITVGATSYSVADLASQARFTQIVVTLSGGTTTYTVTYDANGGTGTMTDSNSPYTYGSTVTILSNTFTKSNYIFDRWNTTNDGSGTYYSAGNTFTISTNTTLYAQWIPVYNDTTYMCVPIDSLTSDDIFIIVGKVAENYYAMSNNHGASSAPDAIQFTTIGDYIFTDNTNVLWKISKNGDNYKFYHNSDTLYCTNNNDGVRIGNGSANIFTMHHGYLYETGTTEARYLGVYNHQTWKCYRDTVDGRILGQKFYFYKRVKNLTEFHTACVRVFNNAENDSTWRNHGNWTFGKLPDDSIYGARIDTAVIVDTTHAVAKHVIINQNTGNGKIIIQPNKGLEVDSTIVVSKNNSYHPTTPNDLVLESSSAGNASLIFNNNNNSQATVYLYSKATYPENGTANWQYIGTSMTELSALYNYYGSWVYKWNNGWEVVHNGDMMQAWKGYCITQRAATTHETSGQLVPTNNIAELPIHSPYTVVANSWTAPIHINEFESSDFDNLSDERIYFFNTGFDPYGDSLVNNTNAPGTYTVIPIKASPYTGDSLIPSQQGFYVKTITDGTLKLNYNRLVRTKGNGDIVAGPLRSPKRTMSSDRPNVLKIYAHGSKFSDRLTILEHEDFSTGFDNGWDGDKMNLSDIAPSIYVVNEDGSFDEVSAIPNYEGTVLGFKNGSDSICHLTFKYDGDNTLYLNDLVMLTSTLISDDNDYIFTCDNTEGVRFIISATPYSGISTDIEHNSDNSKPQKYFYNGNLYIIKNNRIFDAVGNLVK